MSVNMSRKRAPNDSSSSARTRIRTLACSVTDRLRFLVVGACGASEPRRIDVANQLQVLDTRRTRPAPAQMRLDGDLLVDRQLAIDEGVEVLARVLASDVGNHVRSPSSSARSVCRARVSRDFTVPTATPSEKAISS